MTPERFSKNDDPDGCPDTVMGECLPVCARCGRAMDVQSPDEKIRIAREAWAMGKRLAPRPTRPVSLSGYLLACLELDAYLDDQAIANPRSDQ